jgi:hypothetical protein
MIVPTEIEIQIVNEDGHPAPIANVLFGLKIFTSHGGWHNYSFLKSDTEGHIALTRKEILENTQVIFDSSQSDNIPTKFELSIYDGQFVLGLNRSMKQLLALYNDKGLIREDLMRHGIVEDNLPTAMEATEKKRKEDVALYERIKDAVNDKIEVSSPKMEGFWSDTLPKHYEFVVSQRS